MGGVKPAYTAVKGWRRFIEPVTNERPLKRSIEMKRVSSVPAKRVGVASTIGEPDTALVEFDYTGSVRKRRTGTSVTSS